MTPDKDTYDYTRPVPVLTCQFEMEDGLPCGETYFQYQYKPKACPRHTGVNLQLIGLAQARKRKPKPDPAHGSVETVETKPAR